MKMNIEIGSHSTLSINIFTLNNGGTESNDQKPNTKLISTVKASTVI